MGFREYRNYHEKIDEIKKYFGTWPPPFDPPWCVQVSTARSGSNDLWDMVHSFLHEDAIIGAPNYELMEIEGPDANWTPDSGRKYLFYNVFDLNPQRLHFPVFIWMLQHCPKVVFLSREDHFTRMISLYYANIISERFGKDGQEIKRGNFYPEVFSEPVDIDEFNRLLRSSLIHIERLKGIVKTFVDADRLHEIKFSDLYHHHTLQTLGDLVGFLEQDRHTVRIQTRVQRETLHNRIPNLDELLDGFHRDNISERDYWAPEDIDMDPVYAEVNTAIEEMIRLNTPPDKENKLSIQFGKKRFGRDSDELEKDFHFNLDPSLRYYIDELPKSATYLRNDEFAELPNMYENLYLLDSRWEGMEVSIHPHINEFFQVTDIHSNRNRQYKWICGLSVFFMKWTAEDLHRTTPETHNKLIEGVRAMIEYKDRCPETLLRFYVSPEVWERLAQENLLNAENTEFYKMAYPSEDSELGTLWRMLALFDKEFEWAIEADVAPDEDWIFARIAHWDRHTFYDWIEKNTERSWAWAGEYLIYEKNYAEDTKPYWSKNNNIYWDLVAFDYISAGGIVTRPERMPSPESVIHRHIMERPLTFTYYHAGEDVWCSFPCHPHRIPRGWTGWGCDQFIWGRFKKVMPVRHIIHEQSLDHIKNVDAAAISENHLLRRLIAQLHAEGNEFVHWKTLEPIFNFQK